MKSHFLFFSALLIILSNTCNAQTNIVWGDKSKEKVSQTALLLLKNGNTILFENTEEDGMFLDLYDKSKRKITGGLVLNIPKEKAEKRMLLDVFETNGNITVLYARHIKKNSLLYRIQYDGTTGKLINEVTLIDFARPERESDGPYIPPAILNGQLDPAVEFKVSSNKKNGAYLISTSNRYTVNHSKMIEVIHYSADHVEVNKASLTLPGTYSKNDLLDLYPVDDKNLILVSNASDRKEAKGLIYFSKLEKGKTTFQSVELTGIDAYQESACNLAFNKTKNTLNALISLKLSKSKEEYKSIFLVLDVDKMKLNTPLNLPQEKVSASYQTKTMGKKPFFGMPHNYAIDPNGNNVFFTATTAFVSFNAQGGTQIDNIGITSASNEGKENYGFIIPYSVLLNISEGSFAYADDKRYRTNNNYTKARFTDLVAGKKFNYVFLNNTVENFEMPEGKTQNRVNSIGATTSICYKIDNQTGTVVKSYLFEKPKELTGGKLGMFNTSAFNPETGEYAVLVLERQKSDTMESIVWFTLD